MPMIEIRQGDIYDALTIRTIFSRIKHRQYLKLLGNIDFL